MFLLNMLYNRTVLRPDPDVSVDVNYSSLRDVPGGLTGNQQRQIIRSTASQAGLSWGGNFSTPDRPHFYFDPGNRGQRIIVAQRSYCTWSGRC